MQAHSEHRPDVYVAQNELDQLFELIDGPLAHRFPAEAEALRGELDRARIVRDKRSLKRVVTMGSRVEYLDLRSGVRSEITLVFPWEADPAHARVSVLAPVGAALYGLRAGEIIHWHTPMGREHDWQVLAVHPPR